MSSAPEVHLQLNSSGAWKTLCVMGLNDMERCRSAVDVIALADRRQGKVRATYRLAIATDRGLMNPLEYRDPATGWYQA